jgi:hypothetical protein
VFACPVRSLLDKKGFPRPPRNITSEKSTHRLFPNSVRNSETLTRGGTVAAQFRQVISCLYVFFCLRTGDRVLGRNKREQDGNTWRVGSRLISFVISFLGLIFQRISHSVSLPKEDPGSGDRHRGSPADDCGSLATGAEGCVKIPCPCCAVCSSIPRNLSCCFLM